MSSAVSGNTFPHVSVVIPTQERREFLQEALASVNRQDYPAIDIHVAYGHSTDGTLEFLRENGIPHTVVDEPGTGAARVAGLAATTGEILYFLDDDDLMEPTAVSTLVKAMLDAEADLAYGSIVNFLQEGMQAESGATPSLEPNGSFSHLGTTIASPINSSTIVKRSAFTKYGPMDSDNHSWARWYLQAKTSGLSVVRLETLIARRRIHDNNISRRPGNYEKFFDLIRLRLPHNSEKSEPSS